MDEDEEGFAFSLIETFVEQAKDTFTKIEELLGDNNGDTEDNLRQLSQLGHYLKGSAAALGLQMVQNECERIQNYGKKESVAYEDDPLVANANTPQDWLRCCSSAFQQAKIYFEESRQLLSGYFRAPLWVSLPVCLVSQYLTFPNVIDTRIHTFTCSFTHTHTLSLSLSLYIYIYIHVCVYITPTYV